MVLDCSWPPTANFFHIMGASDDVKKFSGLLPNGDHLDDLLSRIELCGENRPVKIVLQCLDAPLNAPTLITSLLKKRVLATPHSELVQFLGFYDSVILALDMPFLETFTSSLRLYLADACP